MEFSILKCIWRIVSIIVLFPVRLGAPVDFDRRATRVLYDTRKMTFVYTKICCTRREQLQEFASQLSRERTVARCRGGQRDELVHLHAQPKCIICRVVEILLCQHSACHGCAKLHPVRYQVCQHERVGVSHSTSHVHFVLAARASNKTHLHMHTARRR